jgi:hypothetical protein
VSLESGGPTASSIRLVPLITNVVTPTLDVLSSSAVNMSGGGSTVCMSSVEGIVLNSTSPLTSTTSVIDMKSSSVADLQSFGNMSVVSSNVTPMSTSPLLEYEEQ